MAMNTSEGVEFTQITFTKKDLIFCISLHTIFKGSVLPFRKDNFPLCSNAMGPLKLCKPVTSYFFIVNKV